MQINLQLLNFDVDRARATVAHLDRHHPELSGRLTSLTLGDFSCQYRNQHVLGDLRDDPAFADFLAWRRERGLKLLWQLPLVIKEFEFKSGTDLIAKVWDDVDGFVTGDLGVLSTLHRRIAELDSPRELVFTSNIVNRRYADLLHERFQIHALRPLFHKRTFIEHDVGFPKDVVVYGNMMINCSVFCFHCGDLPTSCDYSCREPKKLVMENEPMRMVGRSLLTTNRLDLIDRIEGIGAMTRATIMDLDLTPEEVADAIGRIARATPTRPLSVPAGA